LSQFRIHCQVLGSPNLKTRNFAESDMLWLEWMSRLVLIACALCPLFQALHQLVVSVLHQLNSQVMQGNSRG